MLARDQIAAVRAASRDLVRELGFMSNTLAGTAYSASAVHAIIEVGSRGSMRSSELASVLKLEKSTVSRLVKKLRDAGEIALAGGEHDRRARPLCLTHKGEATLKQIEGHANQQVKKALQKMKEIERARAVFGLQAYARALGRAAVEAEMADREQVAVEEGYSTGMVGRIVEMHVRYYSRISGFGEYFERQVAEDLAGFMKRLGQHGSSIWTAKSGRDIVGSIAVEGEDADRAHLRWFILDDSYRGVGLGGALLKQALMHCDDVGYSQVRLWTFKGLEAARTLYERNGFRLLTEREGQRWGEVVTEQEYIRIRPGHDDQSAR